MKTYQNFIKDGKLDGKGLLDYLTKTFKGFEAHYDELIQICKNDFDEDEIRMQTTKKLIHTSQSVLTQLQRLQKEDFSPENQKLLMDSLRYFRQHAEEWRNELRLTDEDYARLDNNPLYSVLIDNGYDDEDYIPGTEFFESELFDEEKLIQNLGNNEKGPKEPALIEVEDFEFYAKELDKKTLNKALYKSDSPKPEDVIQNGDNSCFMLATLRALSRNNPDIIKDIIKENPNEDTVTVRFFTEKDDIRQPIDIKVSKAVPGSYDPNSALWVRLLEKAYAAFLVRKDSPKREISMDEIRKFDAPSFLQFLMPINYKLEFPREEIMKAPDFESGKEKFKELLVSSLTEGNIATITTPDHVMDLTRIGQEGDKTWVYYVDQAVSEVEQKVSIDELFSENSKIDSITVIKLNGMMQASRVSFYPQSLAKELSKKLADLEKANKVEEPQKEEVQPEEIKEPEPELEPEEIKDTEPELEPEVIKETEPEIKQEEIKPVEEKVEIPVMKAPETSHIQMSKPISKPVPVTKNVEIEDEPEEQIKPEQKEWSSIEHADEYYKELQRLVKDLKKTDSIFSSDTQSYKDLHQCIEDNMKELAEVKKSGSPVFFMKLDLAMSYISDHCVEYKNAHKNLKSLSNRQTQRIKVMNRLENLSRRWNKHEPNPTKNLDYMLGEKFVEGYLMTQVKGKDATKYIKTFCDSEKVHENAKKMAESHPFEKYHGAQLSKDIKKQFLYKPCVKAYENSLSLLKMKENEYQELLKTEDGIVNYDVNPEPSVKDDGPSIKSQPVKQQNSSSIKM